MTAKASHRLCDVVLDETIGRSTPDVEHERAVAIFDLIEENAFEPEGHPGGPYRLNLSLINSKLVFAITLENGEPVATHILSLTPFRRIVRRGALSDRPQAVRRACADVLSRGTAKTDGPSAQRAQDIRAIPVGACRRQRAPIFNRAQFPGRRGGGEPLRKGYGRTIGRRSGEGIPHLLF